MKSVCFHLMGCRVFVEQRAAYGTVAFVWLSKTFLRQVFRQQHVGEGKSCLRGLSTDVEVLDPIEPLNTLCEVLESAPAHTRGDTQQSASGWNIHEPDRNLTAHTKHVRYTQHCVEVSEEPTLSEEVVRPCSFAQLWWARGA